ncbi:MAG TPA: ROK family protein [Pseudonocardiaceae bacterium]|jgi:glucokinase|nr:ROK family protein [Pseudonocardiaceae bacterium]
MNTDLWVSERPGHSDPPVAVRPGALALGLDVGGTKLAAGLVTPAGKVRAFATVPTAAADGPDRVVARLCRLAGRLLADTGVRRAELCGVGIGCCGPVNAHTGIVYDPPNLTGWRDIPLAGMVADAVGRPAWVENDATAATVGEWRFGAGRGATDMVYLTISTGVGGGVVAGGTVLRGSSGNGGEPGHVVVVPGGRPCNCGSAGCLEAYVSGTAIADRARDRLAAGQPSTLRAVPVITAEVVAAEAGAGDRLAGEIWRETTDLLGSAVVGLVNLFEPEYVVLGGGVSRTGEQLLAPVRSKVRGSAMRPAATTVDIRLATLGDRVGVVGAAAVAHARATT